MKFPWDEDVLERQNYTKKGAKAHELGINPGAPIFPLTPAFPGAILAVLEKIEIHFHFVRYKGSR